MEWSQVKVSDCLAWLYTVHHEQNGLTHCSNIHFGVIFQITCCIIATAVNAEGGKRQAINIVLATGSVPVIVN